MLTSKEELLRWIKKFEEHGEHTMWLRWNGLVIYIYVPFKLKVRRQFWITLRPAPPLMSKIKDYIFQHSFNGACSVDLKDFRKVIE